MIAAPELLLIGWTHLWQVTLLALAVGLIVRLAAGNRPHLAHALWLVLFIKCVTPPLWSSPNGVFCWMQTARPLGDRQPGDRGNAFRFAADVASPEKTFPVDPPRNPDVTGKDQVAAALPPDGNPSVWLRGDWLLGVWLIGAALAVVLALVRWLVFFRRLRQTGYDESPGMAQHVADLAKRLRVRPLVRILVTRGNIGPAVVGLRRPIILLPAAVIRGKSIAELEPILAHELIHVRRGDLWCGLLQLAVQCLWWFHPLIAVANRLAWREAERCCDEEVLAELACPPAQYARSLLDVLEQSHVFRPAPAFPGMRPIDVTSTRVERIMRLRYGRHKRTPRWCWGVTLLLAAVALPGGPFVAGADESSVAGTNLQAPAGSSGRPVAESRARAETSNQPVVQPQQTASQAEPLMNVVYRVADLVVPIPGVIEVDGSTEPHSLDAKMESLVNLVQETVSPITWNVRGGNGAIHASRSDLLLVISQTAGAHQQISDLLTTLRRLGSSQVVLTIQRVQMSETAYRRQFGWRHGYHPNLLPRVLEQEDYGTLVRDLAGDNGATVKSAGRVTLFPHQTGELPIELEDETATLWLFPELYPDRGTTRLFVAWTDDPRAPVTPSVVVPNGGAILLDVTGRRNRRKKASERDDFYQQPSLSAKLSSAPSARTLLIIHAQQIVERQDE